MSVMVRASRTHVWLEGLGDWSWPGQGGATVDFLPPSWVPAFPPRREAAVGGPALPVRPGPGRARARRVITGVLLAALAAVCVALAHGGQLTLAGLIGTHGATIEQEAPTIASAPSVQSLPMLHAVSQDTAGSSIDSASYPSAALGAEGSFLVYLPAGYDATTIRYPVLYMLTGNNQSNSAYLQIGVQGQLDRLIATHAIAPMIAVMIQGGPGSNNWRNKGTARYESYILEVQQLIDRTLPTVAARDARAVVGDSMGGYGAMNVALRNPYRFGVVESWLSFFNGLEGTLRADAPVISRLGLHAFVYGGEQDRIANPDEDLPFASALRAAGADATGAIYPGEHSLATVEAHLRRMLLFAGRSLRSKPPVTQAQPHDAS